jgi:membrane protease YdiL (CAAX protease family)
VIEPPAPEEIEAEVAVRERSCDPRLGLLFPGLAQLCLGKKAEGATLATLAAAEIGTAIAVAVDTGDGAHPGVQLPVGAVQDLYVFGIADGGITGSLARRDRFAPRDSMADLVAAPFNWQVMKRPAVWLGIIGTLAVGLGATLALSDDIDTDQVGDDPNLFGKTVDPRYGYPIAGATGLMFFSHVAVGEEAFFRGYIQSSLARNSGENAGWVGASLVFGAAHIPNMYALPEEERTDYLLYGLPIITAAGFYLGWVYRDSGYSMAPSTAVHFWYDFLLSAVVFALEPQNSILGTSVEMRF